MASDKDLLQALVFSSMTSQYNPHIVKYVNLGVLFILNLAYAAAILINFVGCLWFYVATLQGLENSWVNGESSGFCRKQNHDGSYMAALEGLESSRVNFAALQLQPQNTDSYIAPRRTPNVCEGVSDKLSEFHLTTWQES